MKALRQKKQTLLGFRAQPGDRRSRQKVGAGLIGAASTGGGAGASASGTEEHARTAGSYQKGMAVFTVAQGGLMYEATIGGQKFGYKPKK